MKVITLDKTKELLGITDSALDAKITYYIPIIDGKVKSITRQRWNTLIYGNLVSGSSYAEIFSYDNCLDIMDILAGEIGHLIEGFGIAADSYIDDVYPNGAPTGTAESQNGIPTAKLNTNATQSADNIPLYIGINQQYQPTIAKGIMFLINSENQTLPGRTLSSRGMGPLATSYSDSDLVIDNISGMPSWFVKALPDYHGGM